MDKTCEIKISITESLISDSVDIVHKEIPGRTHDLYRERRDSANRLEDKVQMID